MDQESRLSAPAAGMKVRAETISRPADCLKNNYFDAQLLFMIFLGKKHTYFLCFNGGLLQLVLVLRYKLKIFRFSSVGWTKQAIQ